MAPRVVLEVSKSGELLATSRVVAHIRLLPRVDAQVSVEVALFGESLAAGGTDEGLLAGLFAINHSERNTWVRSWIRSRPIRE